MRSVRDLDMIFRSLSIFLVAVLAISTIGNVAFADTEINVDALQELQVELEAQFQQERGPVFQRLKAMTTGPMGILNADPNGELVGVRADGTLKYFVIDNLNAAKTTRTNRIQPGGISGYELDGSSIFFLAIWDGGAVRSTHQEFTGRVITMNTVAAHDHATHVAGTMVASGVNASAKGMATSAFINSWDWNSDNSEMTSAALAGTKVSNHSYGFANGWSYGNSGAGNGWYWWGNPSVSETEDLTFGKYTSDARAWDNIVWNNQYYGICKSSGNQQGEGPQPGSTHWYRPGGSWVSSNTVREYDGGTDRYDCIGGKGSAKNVFTIGNANDVINYNGPGSVSLASSSSIGPTDDGRIKPDFVANGVQLTSSTAASNSSYDAYTGTSMATPNFSGSLALLVQFYFDKHNFNYPYSSTMKALIANTADECGPADGPDYKFGWGLMNAHRAADVILADSTDEYLIRQLDLENEAVHTYNFLCDGTEPIKLTISWNDFPGIIAGNILNDRTPRLVNDLDLRLIRDSDGQEYFPYMLDPENPADPATTGDNIVDNVEQIFVENPEQGLYIVEVSHKGALAFPQPYGMVVAGIEEGTERTAAENLTSSVDYATGTVTINWEITDPSDGFVGFNIYRDGEVVGTTATDVLTFNETLEDFGTYVYVVTANYEAGEAIGNPMTTIEYPAASAASFLKYVIYDESAGELWLHWNQLISKLVTPLDDGASDGVITTTTTAIEGYQAAVRYTADRAGYVTKISAFLEESTQQPFGPVSLVLYEASDDDMTPGDIYYQSDVFTPTEEGWADIVLGGFPMEVTEGDDFWVGLYWNEDSEGEVDHTQLANDTNDPQGRGALSQDDGGTWQALSTVFGGFFDGNPLLHAEIGGSVEVGQFGLQGFDLYLDDEEIMTGLTTNGRRIILPGDGVYEYKILSRFDQGDEFSNVLTIDATNLDVPFTEEIPSEFVIGTAYPNPFNPSVSVSVGLAANAQISMRVFDILGREIAKIQTGVLSAGQHRVNWTAENVASGVYFLQINAGTASVVQKVVLMQ
jgi:Subtilase family/Secretion system C-terminal sorting domain